MSERTPEQHAELAEVTKALFGTFGTETADGVKIERIHGWNASGVRYVDPTVEDGTIREMSAAAYVAEFIKVCGISLDEVDFDEAWGDIGYVSHTLGSFIITDEYQLDNILYLQAHPTPVEPAGLPRQDYYGGA